MTGQIQIVLVDDHAVVRSGLKLLLEAEPDFKVIGEASDVDGAVAEVRAKQPDVLLLDLGMPGRSPLTAISEFLANGKTKVVILTMHDDPGYAQEALRSGASGYILKEAADMELVQAVRAVVAGSTYLHPELGARLAQGTEERPGKAGPGDLTEREAEVLGMLALGHTNQEIADRLYLSVRTVESHRAHIQQKLRLASRAELVRYALDHGLIRH